MEVTYLVIIFSQRKTSFGEWLVVRSLRVTVYFAKAKHTAHFADWQVVSAAAPDGEGDSTISALKQLVTNLMKQVTSSEFK